MKRFLLFTWDQHYPNGGFNDFRESFDGVDDALETGNAIVAGNGLKWYQVYDIVEGCEVALASGVWEP